MYRRRKRRRIDILYALIALSCAALVLVCIALIDILQSEAKTVSIENENHDKSTIATKVKSTPTINKNEINNISHIVPSKTANIYMEIGQNLENSEYMVLVNRKNPNQNTERPDNLITMGEFFSDEVMLQNPQGSINKTAAEAAKHMFKDAKKTGIGTYIITTAYRSVHYQENKYQQYIMDHPQEEICKVLPGNASEHTTGLAIDILSESHNIADDDFFLTQEGQWLYDHAHEYGFILRYPKNKESITKVIFEPWHYRYVGKDAAKIIHENNICLEEFLDREG